MKKEDPTLPATKRLEEVRSKLESLIDKNRKGVGTGKPINEIEEELFANILDIGKLLLEDRIIEEEKQVENTAYSIKGKKNKEPGKK